VVVLITDPAFGDDVIIRCVQKAGAALPAGALCVQLRDKGRPLVSLRLFAWQLRKATHSVGALFVVNGDARLARDVGADGVHVPGAESRVECARAVLRHGWISVAAHSDIDVLAAADQGADAVLVSPVFVTRPPSLLAKSKSGRGLGAIRSARLAAGSRLAIYALGGVSPDNAGDCVSAGANGVAVIRALLGSGDCARVARALHDAVVRRC
jgi:thiamine-phosphate pyrophosphorylase